MNSTLSELTVSAEALEAFTVDALKKAGLSAADARTTAQVLVTTDTWGVFTHGVNSLHRYIQRLIAGGLNPRGVPTIVAEGPAWARVDGQNSVAMVTSVRAMEIAIAKARQCGIAYVGVFNTCHFGAAGYYATMAAEQNMFGVAMANDAPSMNAPGARGRVTGNNPLAFAIPMSPRKPIVLDMALSTVAGGKVSAAHINGKPIPPDWVVDMDGNPSSDPAAFVNGGSLSPMAGYKGYGMAIVVETLAAVMPGASMLADVLRWKIDNVATPTGHGAAFIAIDVEKMMPMDQYQSRAEAMAARIKASPTRTSKDRILMPGEREWDTRDRALRDGIVLPADVVLSLRELCDELKLDLDALRR